MATETRRPFIKISIDLPVFVKKEHAKEIAGVAHEFSVTNLVLQPRRVEIEFRPPHNGAAGACRELVDAVMATFPDETEGEAQGG